MAFAQTGSIGLFADVGATNCDVYDVVPGLVIVYVVHVYTPGATAAQFKVDHLSWGAGTLTYLAEFATPPYIPIGNSQTGITIAYGSCQPSPNMIMTIQYFGSALTPPCSYIQVVPDPAANPPGILVAECTPPSLKVATGGDVVVNPDPTCFCNIPVEETTWGQVKALYQ
jgi:hypothetical protein